MTGTGTKADPYIVETWAELVDKVKTAQSSLTYIKVKDDTVWDMNDLYSGSAPPQLYISGNWSIDGNGVVVKNLRTLTTIPIYFFNRNNGKSIYFKNFKFENILCDASWFIKCAESPYRDLVSIYDNVFTGFIANDFMKLTTGDYNWSSSFSPVYFFRNGVNIEFPNDSKKHMFAELYMNMGGANPFQIYDNYIKIRGKEVSIFNVSDRLDSAQLHNNLFEVYADEAYFDYTTKHIGQYMDKCFIIGECPNFTLNYSDRGPNIYNKDKITAYSTDGNTKNIIGVTEEQLKDATYLRSLGFPIGV